MQSFNADIITIGETHLRGHDELCLDNYKFVGHNRVHINVHANKGSGGVCFFIKYALLNDYEYKIVDKSIDGVLAIVFTHKISGYTFAVINGYLPPENTVWGRDATQFMCHILSLIYMLCNCDAVYLVGDVNSKLGNLNDFISDIDDIPMRQVIDSAKNKHGDAFLDFLIESKMCVLNGRVTPEFDNFTCVSPKGSSVVDYIAVSHDNIYNCNYFKVHLVRDLMTAANVYHNKVPDHSLLELSFSPHVVVSNDPVNPSVNVNVSNVHNITGRYGQNSHPSVKKYNIKAGMPGTFLSSDMSRQAILTCIDKIETARAEQDEIDSLYTDFCNVYYDELNKFFVCKSMNTAAKKRMRHSSKPYWNDELFDLWKRVCESEKRYLSAPQNSRLRKNFRASFMSEQNVFDKAFKKAKRIYEREKRVHIENLNTENPKDFWAAIRKLGPQKSIKIPFEVYDDHGNIVTDVNVVLNKWATEYESLYKGHCETNFDNVFYDNVIRDKNYLEQLSDIDAEYNYDISLNEVKCVTRKAKNNKAVGLDYIPYEVFKNEQSLSILVSLFNKIFVTHLIPCIWRKAILRPIPKSSTIDPRLPLQYRGIALLSTVYKLYASVLNNRLVTYLDKENIYAEEQNGFRKKRSCTDHVYTLSTILRNRIAQRQSTFIAYLDAEKAFDRIDRDLMLYKLLKVGVHGHLYENIKAIYSKSLCSISINDLLTDWFDTKSGVRQGDTLSPTLFGIFVNDVVTDVNKLNVGLDISGRQISILLYADDIVLLSESEDGLQTMLNEIDKWSRKWRIKFNARKSQVVHYRNRGTPCTDYVFRMGNINLDLVKQYKYLGVTLNEFLDYDVIAKVLADSGNRALGAIINKYKSLSGLGYHTYTKMYHSGVTPILDYSCEIWGHKDFSIINSVQHKAMRVFLGLHRFAPIPAMNGDMCWTSSNVRRKIAICRYWNRLLNMDNSRLSKIVFLWDYNMNKKYNWSAYVKCIFEEISMIDLYQSKSELDIDNVKRYLNEKFHDYWSNSVKSMPKLRTYRLFKDTFAIEPYVESFMSRRQRSLVSQLRSGILPLAIETGRWRGQKLEERVCQICNSSTVEDEIHFVFLCNVYDLERQNFFSNIKDAPVNWQNFTYNEKLKLFMNAVNVVNFSKYLSSIYEKRRSILFI